MFLRANSILLKPNAFVVGVFEGRSSSRINCGPRFCSSNMDKKQQHEQQKTPSGEVMSSSFGEGYATRSDEEGFGGVYSDTQQLNKDRKEINENSPEHNKDYDKSQGSEVKEKEKGRNQHKDSACK